MGNSKVIIGEPTGRRGRQWTKETSAGQQAMLHAIVKHFDGYQRLADKLTPQLGIQLFKSDVANWVHRGKVPLLYVERVANALGVSPYALNYLEYAEFKDHEPTWKEVVQSARFLTLDRRQEIYKKTPPMGGL